MREIKSESNGRVDWVLVLPVMPVCLFLTPAAFSHSCFFFLLRTRTLPCLASASGLTGRVESALRQVVAGAKGRAISDPRRANNLDFGSWERGQVGKPS